MAPPHFCYNSIFVVELISRLVCGQTHLGEAPNVSDHHRSRAQGSNDRPHREQRPLCLFLRRSNGECLVNDVRYRFRLSLLRRF